VGIVVFTFYRGDIGMKLHRFICPAVICMVAFFIGFIPTAYAIDMNGYRLITSLTAKGTFDDNYFLVNDDITGTKAEEVFVTTVTPDLKFEVGEINKFSLGFRSDLIVVEGLKEENRQNQTYSAGFEYNPGGRLSLKIDDSLMDVEDQASREGEDRSQRVQNDLNASMTYQITEKLGSEVIIKWSNFDHDVFNKQLTRDEYYATFRGNYLIFPRTQAFLGYRYSDFVFTGLKFILEEQSALGRTAGELDMDNQGHTFQAGLNFLQLPVGAGRLQGKIWVGYQRIDFQRQKDQDEIVFESRLTYLPSPRTNVVLLASRKHSASPLVSGNNVINSSVRLDVIYKFYERFQLSLGAGYRNADYTEPTSIRLATGEPNRVEREDNTVSFKAGLRYNFYKYFTAGVSYDFVDKSVDPSALRDREYTQNKVTFMLGGTF
jgi:opacity protein-like surface antigen